MSTKSVKPKTAGVKRPASVALKASSQKKSAPALKRAKTSPATVTPAITKAVAQKKKTSAKPVAVSVSADVVRHTRAPVKAAPKKPAVAAGTPKKASVKTVVPRLASQKGSKKTTTVVKRKPAGSVSKSQKAGGKTEDSKDVVKKRRSTKPKKKPDTPGSSQIFLHLRRNKEALEELKNDPNALVIDVSLTGEDPKWSRFSQFHVHEEGGIAIPEAVKHVQDAKGDEITEAATVAGIWHALKNFLYEGPDFTRLAKLKPKGIKRTAAKTPRHANGSFMACVPAVEPEPKTKLELAEEAEQEAIAAHQAKIDAIEYANDPAVDENGDAIPYVKPKKVKKPKDKKARGIYVNHYCAPGAFLDYARAVRKIFRPAYGYKVNTYLQAEFDELVAHLQADPNNTIHFITNNVNENLDGPQDKRTPAPENVSDAAVLKSMLAEAAGLGI